MVGYQLISKLNFAPQISFCIFFVSFLCSTSPVMLFLPVSLLFTLMNIIQFYNFNHISWKLILKSTNLAWHVFHHCANYSFERASPFFLCFCIFNFDFFLHCSFKACFCCFPSYADFEINIVVVMKDDYLISENFPLSIYRN